MSTRLFLVRHAETIWADRPRVHGRSDPPLSDTGCQQALALAEALSARSVQAVYTSPLQRACKTATAIAARHGLNPCVEAGLEELGLGTWEGQAIADLKADPSGSYCSWLISPDELTPPKGESLRDALARVSPIMALLLKRHPNESIVVVTHSIVGRIIIAHFLDAGLGLVPRLKLKTASISVLRLDPDRGVLERLGDVSHLANVARREHAS